MSKENNGNIWQLPGRIWATVQRSIFETPKSIGEALWRVASVSMVTGFLTSGFMVWRYPDVVRSAINHDQIENEIILEIFEREPEIKLESMDLIATYVNTYGPTHVAIVNWETQTGIHHVWSSSSTRFWPMSTDGVMSPNMRNVVGFLIFDQCFVGTIEHSSTQGASMVSDQNWLVCGLSNEQDIWGYVISSWNGAEAPRHAIDALRVMTERLENVIFAD